MKVYFQEVYLEKHFAALELAEQRSRPQQRDNFVEQMKQNNLRFEEKYNLIVQAGKTLWLQDDTAKMNYNFRDFLQT